MAKLIRYPDLLLECFKDEVSGALLFAQLAEGSVWTIRERGKLARLASLEMCISQVLGEILIRNRRAVDVEAATRRANSAAMDLFAAAGAASWMDFLRDLGRVVPAYLDKYRALHDLGPPEDHVALAFLVRHEEALGAFCRAELDGQDGLSMIAIDEILAELARLRGGPITR